MSVDESRLCERCRTAPCDRQGHFALAPRLEEIDRRTRSRTWLSFQCRECATRWARHRIRGGVYEWKRVL